MGPLMETKNKGINHLDTRTTTLAALAQVILLLEMLKFSKNMFFAKIFLKKKRNKEDFEILRNILFLKSISI